MLFFFFNGICVIRVSCIRESAHSNQREKRKKMFLFGSPVNRVKARRPRFLLTLLFNIAFILPWRFVSRTQFYLHTHTNILSLSVIIFCTLSSPSLWFLFGVRNRMMIKKLQSKKCGVPYISYCIKQWLKRWNNISYVKFLEQWNDRDRLIRPSSSPDIVPLDIISLEKYLKNRVYATKFFEMVELF